MSDAVRDGSATVVLGNQATPDDPVSLPAATGQHDHRERDSRPFCFAHPAQELYVGVGPL